MRDLEGRYDRKYPCLHYFTVNFFLSGCGIHVLCLSEVTLPIRLKYMRKKAFYAYQTYEVTKIRMEQQNVSYEKWKECVCVTGHAACTNEPVTLWRRQKQKLSDGKKFPIPRPRSRWTAAFSPAHERYNCIPISLSQESSPSGGERPLYLPGLQGQ